MTLSENATNLFVKRYAFDENEDWQKLSIRVGRGCAQFENGKFIEYGEKFSEVIFNGDFIPAGRILRNMGRPRGSLFNCFVLPCGDSREEIGQWFKDSLILWGEGGGVGCNLSFLRPKGAPIKGVGGSSSGPVSFLEASNAVAKTVESGGSRRAAALATMLVTHPDILEFIDAKMIHGTLSHYNISVAVTEDFIETVERDGDWEYKFAQQSYGKIKAREIWDKIMVNMVKHAEPGLINWDNLRSNNSYYFQEIIATNPCGEVPLSGYGVCCLGSLNLPNFITNVNTNWKKLEQTIHLAIRFLDNVIDINKYVLHEIDLNAHNGRRIGLGVMGLADYLFIKKIRYGSPKAIEEIEKLFKFIRDVAYEASISLAVEKGAFPKFDPVQYGKAHFIRSLPASFRMAIKDKGIRNVTLLAMAPTGTISLLPEVCGGIEPLYAKAYRRNDKLGERLYVHPLYKNLLTSKEPVPEWFVDSFDLKPEDHFETQVIVQKYTDSSVSKTINMPRGTTQEDLSKLTLEYIKDLKGVTVYVDGCRDGQVLEPVKEKEVRKFIEKNQTDSNTDEDSVRCSSGTCDI